VVGSLILAVMPAFAGTGGYAVSIQDGVLGGTTMATVTNGGSNGRAAVTEATDLYVEGRCFQGGGQLVYWERAWVDPAIGGGMLHLGPTSLWTGGSAKCTGELVYFDVARQGWVRLDRTSFQVSG
jgi:hypothetical protein